MEEVSYPNKENDDCDNMERDKEIVKSLPPKGCREDDKDVGSNECDKTCLCRPRLDVTLESASD